MIKKTFFKKNVGTYFKDFSVFLIKIQSKRAKLSTFKKPMLYSTLFRNIKTPLLLFVSLTLIDREQS